MGELIFQNEDQILKMSDELSRRKLFARCEELVRHYPTGEWLQIACNYIKKRAVIIDWDMIDEETVSIIKDIVEKLK